MKGNGVGLERCLLILSSRPILVMAYGSDGNSEPTKFITTVTCKSAPIKACIEEIRDSFLTKITSNLWTIFFVFKIFRCQVLILSMQ